MMLKWVRTGNQVTTEQIKDPQTKICRNIKPFMDLWISAKSTDSISKISLFAHSDISHTLNQMINHMKETKVRKCAEVKPNRLTSPFYLCPLSLSLSLFVINALLFFIVPVSGDPATMSCLDVGLDNQWDGSAAVGAGVFLLVLIPAKACWGRPLSRLSHTPLSLMPRLLQAAA